MQYKTFITETKAVDPAAGIYEAMISTESADRDSDILVANGANLQDYQRNPVVLYAHNYAELPVAKALEVQIIDGIGLRARFQFPEKGVSEKADAVHRLWAGGFLNATSVGFQAKQMEPIPNGGMKFREWDLLEFSIVPVPANAGALRLAAKALDEDLFQKRGRVISAKNESLLRAAADNLQAVLSALGDEEPMNDEGKSLTKTETPLEQTQDNPAEPPIDIEREPAPLHDESEAALDEFAKALINLVENWSK